jgi:hypothetical protein
LDWVGKGKKIGKSILYSPDILLKRIEESLERGVFSDKDLDTAIMATVAVGVVGTGARKLPYTAKAALVAALVARQFIKPNPD